MDAGQDRDLFEIETTVRKFVVNQDKQLVTCVQCSEGLNKIVGVSADSRKAVTNVSTVDQDSQRCTF